VDEEDALPMDFRVTAWNHLSLALSPGGGEGIMDF